MRIDARLVVLSLLLSIALPGMVALAQQKPSKAPPDPTEDPLMMTSGFLSSHPDLRFRLIALEEMKKGRPRDAFRFFQRAAFYGDKPSQGMVAELLSTGQGVERDPVLAYVWMDLAAERSYAGFLNMRERYWNALTEGQRAQAIELGQEVYAKYGDAAALPRLATILRREKKRSTGSRTGFVGSLKIYVPGPGGFEVIDGSKFYDDRYWDPKQYQAWHDSVWMKPRVGRVTVGEVEQEKKAPGSRIPATTPKVDAEEPETPQRDESRLGTSKDDE